MSPKPKQAPIIPKDYSNQLILLMANWSRPHNDLENCLTAEPGMDDVIKAIKFMLENSLFFHPDVVKEQHRQMLIEGFQMHRRRTTDKEVDNLFNSFPEDKDGNYKVRSIIKNLVGEKVSQGNLQNSLSFIKISHIWGNAFNPLYFTSLWNIVLIPAYCNDLMDKPAGDFPTIVKNVYKAVCNYLYQADAKLIELASCVNLAGQNLEVPSGISVKNDRDAIRIELNDGNYNGTICAKLSFLTLKQS